MATLNSPTLGRHSVEVDGVTADSVEWADVENVPTSLTAAQAAGTASIRALGAGATQASAGNHTHTGLMTGAATNVANSAAADIEGLVEDFNDLLTALAARGVITNT